MYVGPKPDKNSKLSCKLSATNTPAQKTIQDNLFGNEKGMQEVALEKLELNRFPP